ncbi:sensor histidine kinase [Bifidobacterium lemurum]|nr:histidine kinase [Bifidobacterium lemurum]QOL34133.1 two-component sensor histidine kinase [Bifidobacterium lemurum]
MSRLMLVTGLLDKLLLMALCALLLVQWRGAVTARDVAVILTAVCCASATEWMLTTMRFSWAWVPGCLMIVCSLILPTFLFTLPTVAFDACRLADHPNTARNPHQRLAMQRSESWLRQIGRVTVLPYLWMVPLCWTLLAHPDWRATGAVIALLTVMAFLWGSSAHRQTLTGLRLNRIQDERRNSVRALRDQLSDAHEDRMTATRTAMLNERTRIARDIHDNVGHLLTRAIMQSEASRVLAEARHDAVSEQGFADIHSTLDEAMTMVRRSVHDLDDEGVDFAAWMADAARSTGRLRVDLRSTVTDAPAPVARCFAVVIRESLSNAARHSTANRVTVVAQEFPAFWQLVVQDNGDAVAWRNPHGSGGIAPTMPSRPTGRTAVMPREDRRGMGLADIEARVRALDGVCSTGPHGDGWRVFVSIPKAPFAHRNGEIQSLARNTRNGADS